MAKICQEVERWGEMLEHVSAFRGFAGALTPFERKLLHTAFAGKVSHLFKSLHAARGVAAVAVEVGDKLEAECVVRKQVA
jgi:hypothetical protein